MTRPDDIPERVWEEARHLCDPHWLTREPIARAILAAEERVREKCAAEMSAMRRDWCEFCNMIGVPVDTHEAVAEQLIADRELIAEAKRYSAAIRKGGEDA